MNAASVICDMVKLVPSLAWLVVCLFAIPSYVRIGWVTPVICAVYSAIISILATYDIFVYQSKTLHEYVPLMVTGDLNTNDHVATEAAETNHTIAPSRTKWLFTKMVLSMIITTTTLAFTILFLIVAFAVIDPEKRNIPCDGECEDCIEDQNCSQWIASVEKKHPITNICPPTKASADTDATFSCKADGLWMIVTFVVTMGWLCAMIFAYKRRSEIGGHISAQRAHTTHLMSQWVDSFMGRL